MDLQGFCVQNRKKVHSFQLLQSSVHPTHKMPQTFQFGVPVKAGDLEDHCFNVCPNMSCKTELNFQDITKNSECLGKKTCFESISKFSPFSCSKVVGGFVGSKSQGGSASREPHQVWDVILRQLIDTCQTRLNNNLQQYFNVEDSLSGTIFQQFTSVGNSHLDFSSYIISRPDDFFASKKMTVDQHGWGANLCQNKDIQISENKSLHLPKISTENQKTMNRVDISNYLSSPKQSYADVAKSHVPSRLEYSKVSDIPPRILNSFMVNRQVQNPQCRMKGHEKGRRRRTRDEISNNEHSPSISSQSLKKSSPSLRSCDDHMASPKFIQDNFQQTSHSRFTNLHNNKRRINDTGYLQQQSQQKDYKPCGERRNRSSKFRNYNMRNKERKNIDLQVNEDLAYVCNMAKSECQNWRCEHNRTNVLRNRTRFPCPQERNFNRMNGVSVRLRSPPPRTFSVTQSCSNSAHTIDTPCAKMEEVNKKTCKEIQNNGCRLDGSTILNMTSTEDISESSAFSPSTVCSDRPHLISECSVDSEDSCVVFVKEDVESIVSSEDDSETGSESDSECDSETDSSVAGGDDIDDEVDFQYFSPLNIAISGAPSDILKNSFLPVPDRLKDVNKRWRDETNYLSDDAKTPKKVHFANPGHLFRVHLMVHWGFAHREARRGPWEEVGRDRCRFQMRISNAEKELACVLDPEHRRKVWEERMSCLLV